MARKPKSQKESAPAETPTGEIPNAEQIKGAESKGQFLARFTQQANQVPEGYKRLTLAPMIPPSQLAPGVALTGTVLAVQPSPTSAFKQAVLLMRHQSGAEFTFPCTAVLRGAVNTHLGRKRDEDINPGDKKVVGLDLMIVGGGKKSHSDGKRTVNVFEVYVKE